MKKILGKKRLSREEIITLLALKAPGNNSLHQKALEIKEAAVGRKVYLRGLIEYSNHCYKNCFYCGIRSDNTRYRRYHLTDEEVMEAARYTHRNRFASLIIQSGENRSREFVSTIERLLKAITRETNGELHITLSLGEQTKESYRRWLEAGAHRYLLRIETSNPDLYKKLHPDDRHHSYSSRLEALKRLRETGYQVGTGVMVGLPFQTYNDLADDLLFFCQEDIDMIGMGPYIEHRETPLFNYRDQLLPLKERLDLSLNMVALLRILMKDINIAATTAMQTIDPRGRERALLAGANVMMPNLTPLRYRQSYLLYNDKDGVADDAEESKEAMEEEIRLAGDTVGYGEWGDSKRFIRRRGGQADKRTSGQEDRRTSE